MPERNMEPCCECGNDYPRDELVNQGHIYCRKCRVSEAIRKVTPGVPIVLSACPANFLDGLQAARDQHDAAFVYRLNMRSPRCQPEDGTPAYRRVLASVPGLVACLERIGLTLEGATQAEFETIREELKRLGYEFHSATRLPIPPAAEIIDK